MSDNLPAPRSENWPAADLRAELRKLNRIHLQESPNPLLKGKDFWPNHPFRISHAILAENGGDVVAAGEGRAGIFLSNTTGHYKTEEFVLPAVKNALGKIGIFFKR